MAEGSVQSAGEFFGHGNADIDLAEFKIMGSENDNLQSLRDRICFMLSNRLTYPKALLSIARDRALTEAEIQKAFECFRECIQFADAELTLFKAHSGDQGTQEI